MQIIATHVHQLKKGFKDSTRLQELLDQHQIDIMLNQQLKDMTELCTTAKAELTTAISNAKVFREEELTDCYKFLNQNGNFS